MLKYLENKKQGGTLFNSYKWPIVQISKKKKLSNRKTAYCLTKISMVLSILYSMIGLVSINVAETHQTVILTEVTIKKGETAFSIQQRLTPNMDIRDALHISQRYNPHLDYWKNIKAGETYQFIQEVTSNEPLTHNSRPS